VYLVSSERRAFHDDQTNSAVRAILKGILQVTNKSSSAKSKTLRVLVMSSEADYAFQVTVQQRH
jgi:hypothetical protein